jgi:hypothetical protein
VCLISLSLSVSLCLPQECGVDYTSKLDGMFTDIDLAKNVLQAYKQSLLSSQSPPSSQEIETDIMVLTTSYWPTYPIIEMKIPPEITHQMVSSSSRLFPSPPQDPLQNSFSSFYNEKYQGRRLAWQHSTER